MTTTKLHSLFLNPIIIVVAVIIIPIIPGVSLSYLKI